MKKILLLSMALSSFLMADCNLETCTKQETMNWQNDYKITSKDQTGKEYFLNIKNFQRDVHVGLSSVSIREDRRADVSIGVGLSAIVDNNIYLGGNLDSELVKAHKNDVVGLTGEIKGGYLFDNGVVGYGLVGVKAMDDGVGLGAGIGAEYKLCPKTIGAIEYKQYNMKLDGSIPDYTYESFGAKIKYLF